jgi:hypothetical protein
MAELYHCTIIAAINQIEYSNAVSLITKPIRYVLLGGDVSKEQHASAVLTGFHGPFFPSAVGNLGDELHRGGFSGEWLGRVVAAMPGYVGMDLDPRTSDGYGWYRRIEFVRKLGRVIVLIPWSQDWDHHDGIQADRSIAVYADGDVEVGTYEALVHELLAAAKRQRDAESRASEAGLDILLAEQTRVGAFGLFGALVTVQADGEDVGTRPIHISAHRLNARILDRSHWPQRRNLPGDATLVVFKTPVADYRGLTDGLVPEDGCSVTLGGLSTYAGSSNHFVEVPLEAGHYYDVLLIGHDAGGDCRVIGWVRYATTPGEDQLAQELTLEEAKLAALLFIDLTRHMGEFVEASAVRMSAWSDCGHHNVAGFDFGPPLEDDTAKHLGVMVFDTGYAQLYHGYAAEEVRRHLGV